MTSEKPSKEDAQSDEMDRRSFLSTTKSIAMTGGLIAGYGAFGAVAGRYLYPAKPQPTGWVFVTDLKSIKKGSAMAFRTPSGAAATIARKDDKGDVSDFVALSSTCPHLGCQVHWEAQNSRFFCPCHNGVFDASGKATSGPPAAAGQSLMRYPLKVENGLLFIQVPIEKMADAEDQMECEQEGSQKRG